MKPGSLPWSRAWYGPQCRRGQHVLLPNGQRARVLSARDGFVAVRVWATAQRLIVRPSELRVAA